MLITKIFKAESMHRVVNCSSEYCKYSCHGHSAVIEVTFKGTQPDNGGMVYDFGLMKGTIKQFIESMDHAALLYSYDDPKYVSFIKEFNQRWILLPVSPSAEFLSAFIFQYIKFIINHTVPENGEGPIRVYSVKYHETTTGSATCFEDDLHIWFPEKFIKEVQFSEGIKNEWSDDLLKIMEDRDNEIFRYLCDEGLIYNEEPEQQVKKNW